MTTVVASADDTLSACPAPTEVSLRVETGSVAFGWGGSPVDYRDDELDLAEDGDDLAVTPDDLCDLDGD